MLITERRRARSSHPPDALQLLLQHARRKLGVRALTLGTASGALVAGAGAGEDLEQVAGLGADIDAGGRSSKPVATWRMRVGERDLLLTSLRGAMDPDLAAAVRRILA